MGNHLINILAEAGHQVYVTTRSDRINTHNITYLKGNAHESLFLERVLSERSYDCIVDLHRSLRNVILCCCVLRLNIFF